MKLNEAVSDYDSIIKQIDDQIKKLQSELKKKDSVAKKAPNSSAHIEDLNNVLSKLNVATNFINAKGSKTRKEKQGSYKDSLKPASFDKSKHGW